jgi:3-oxosteroid 1-dehydrogenase
MNNSSYDFVIVGSGGGAFAAALLARANGLSPVIVEKRLKVGGTTGYSGGVVWIPNNPLMQRENVGDSLEQARQYLAALLGPPCPGSSRAKREAFLAAGPEVISFLEREGMQFARAEGWSDYHDELPGGMARGRGLVAPLFDLNELGEWRDKLSVYEGWTLPMNSGEFNDLMLAKRTWRGRYMALALAIRMLKQKIGGAAYRGSGAALQGRLLQIALRHQIPILTDTQVTGFRMAADRVGGIIARQNGQQLEITARHGVLLNAGGFAHNSPMRARLQPKPTPHWTNANPGDTGEVLQAAMALGAATHNLDLSWYTPASTMQNGDLPPGTTAPFMHHLDLAKPHVVMVDAKGNRFADESGSYHENGKAMYERATWPCFAILESRHRNNYPWGTVPPGPPPAEWLSSGYMVRASSISELAGRCGIDPAGVTATVARFNGFCRTGIDTDFARGARAFDRHHGDPTCRPNPNLGPIEQPPFYAVRMVPGDIGTDGGVVTDEHARVLREDGTVIEGLYATGNTTASVMARAYPGPGGTIGPAMVFGYIAARHASGVAAKPDSPALHVVKPV